MLIALIVALKVNVCSSYNLHWFLKSVPHKFELYVTSSQGPESERRDDVESFLNYKPWRGPKPHQLKVTYLPWSESWQEVGRNESDTTIYLYSVPEKRSNFDATRLNEVWMWPWLWSKIKAERLSLIQKTFDNSLKSMSVQQHMELDSFYAEFDMPVRWGLLRLKELEVLNILVLWIAFWTDFHGTRPSDLGVRPDGSVRTCSVELHNCISSSNAVTDTDHYAPPFRWSRSKSPEQAFEEVKSAYNNYPKRGLKWTNGWIDRGGWKPQQFSGNYFYAQADSLAFRWTDDVELVLDNAKREVQYRSASRLGREDFDVQRLRYNQFARMLGPKGGWEVQPLPRLHYLSATPFRWTSRLLDTVGATLSGGAASTGYKESFVDAQAAASGALEGVVSRVTTTARSPSDMLRHLNQLAPKESELLIIMGTLQEWWHSGVTRLNGWVTYGNSVIESLGSDAPYTDASEPQFIISAGNDPPDDNKLYVKEDLIGKYLLREDAP